MAAGVDGGAWVGAGTAGGGLMGQVGVVGAVMGWVIDCVGRWLRGVGWVWDEMRMGTIWSIWSTEYGV